MKLVNGVITDLLDPNVFYSRFSFLESGKDALDIKLRINQKGKKQDSKSKFYTRSALVKNLIPNPSEGRVRKLFCGYKDTSKTQLAPQPSSILSQAAQKSVFGLNNRLSPLNHESSAAYQQESAVFDQQTEIGKESQMLDLINKVQMFQIAGSKANKSLEGRRKQPVFDLQFTAAFNQTGGGVSGQDAAAIDKTQLLHAPSSMIDLED